MCLHPSESAGSLFRYVGGRLLFIVDSCRMTHLSSFVSKGNLKSQMSTSYLLTCWGKSRLIKTCNWNVKK